MSTQKTRQREWHVRGATAQGVGHRVTGAPCQDAFRFEKVDDSAGRSVHIIAVADGAGSQKRSAEGANLAVGMAVQAASELIVTHQAPRYVDEYKVIVDGAMEAVLERFPRVIAAVAEDAPPNHFAATLTIAILSSSVLAWASVGDCFVVLRTDDGSRDRFHLVDSDPGNGPGDGQVSTGTTFITSSGGHPAYRSKVLDDDRVTGLVISTDGLAQPMLEFDGQSPVRARQNVFTRVIGYFDGPPRKNDQDLVKFLLGDQTRQYTLDDKTLVVAVRS